MISPSQDPEPVAPAASLLDEVDVFFRPGGKLEKACANEPFPYEPRPQQRQMADAVAEAIAGSQHLAVEAGTGVGKSFAYLVPAILAAKQTNTKVVISTYTISLQEQLMYKDIPFLQEHLGIDFRATLVKGRGNYLCLRRMARAKKMAGDLFKRSPEAELSFIRRWAGETEEGSLQDLVQQPSSDVWQLVCAEQGNCTWQQCPEFAPCFFMKARARMQEADILIVNHHLFFSDLALRGAGAGFLPDYDVVVLDEAHCVEGVATEHMGLRLSHRGFEHWLRRIFVPDTGKGLLGLLRRGEEAHLVTRIWDEARSFFEKIRAEAALGPGQVQRVVEEPLAIETVLPELTGKLTGMLRDLVEEVEDGDIRAELQSAARRGSGLREALDTYLCQSLSDHVYWIEQEGRRKQMVLYSAPVEVAPLLRKSLFDQSPCVVMTSATLAVRDSMDYLCSRLGADECEALQVGSPFDYARQMRVYLAKGLPDPNDEAGFLDKGTQAVEHFLDRSKGRAFVLFTSARRMKAVAERMGPFMDERGYTLLVQDGRLPRHAMLDQFQRGEANVLFGLASFWMGVDVRGEALSNVIITRLPFAVPDHPIVKARMERIREQGGDPFKEYSLPEAVLKFRQGIGRLVRTATDEGMVAILDSRILGKWYGRYFLDSLPDCPVEAVDVP